MTAVGAGIDSAQLRQERQAPRFGTHFAASNPHIVDGNSHPAGMTHQTLATPKSHGNLKGSHSGIATVV